MVDERMLPEKEAPAPALPSTTRYSVDPKLDVSSGLFNSRFLLSFSAGFLTSLYFNKGARSVPCPGITTPGLRITSAVHSFFLGAACAHCSYIFDGSSRK